MAPLESAAMGIDGSIAVTAGLCPPNAHQGVTEAERPAKDREAAIPFMDCCIVDRGIRATAAAQSPWPMVLACSLPARAVAGIAR